MKIKLKDYPNNPRTISDDALSRLGKSMQEFGDLSGIVLNKRDGYLISGHQRVKSLIERYGKYDIDIVETLPDGEQRGHVEPEHISFRLVDWDEGKAGAARLAANKQGGEWVQDKLDDELQKLIDLDIDMDLTGFEESQEVDYEEMWQGMPEYNNEDKTSFRHITVHFRNHEDAFDFGKLIGQKITESTRSLWHPKIDIETYADKVYTSES